MGEEGKDLNSRLVGTGGWVGGEEGEEVGSEIEAEWSLEREENVFRHRFSVLYP